MVDAQTEARVIAEAMKRRPYLPDIADLPHDIANWTDSVLSVVLATALAAKDALAAVDREIAKKTANDVLAWKQRAERAEAQLAEARKALANYDRWLNGRDAYIVQKGLWQNFVASLPGSPTARRAREAQGGQNV